MRNPSSGSPEKSLPGHSQVEKTTPSPGARQKQPPGPPLLWIGQRVCVLSSACKGVQGQTGVVIDETRFTVILESAKNRRVRLGKTGLRLAFLDSGAVVDAAKHQVPPAEKRK